MPARLARTQYVLARRWKVLVPLIVVFATVTAVFGIKAPPARAGIATGHDNSTASSHEFAWTHGDPNTGLIPGSTSDGYYYLKAYADGPFVWCEVYSGGNWLVQLIHGNAKDVVAQNTFSGTGGRVAITNGTTGDEYQCRIANTSPPVSQGGQVQKDYAELNSANSADVMTTGDCGGPGPAADPNFGGTKPMEPIAPDPFPNGCNGHPGDAPPVAGSPQLAPPAQQSFDVGPVASGGHTYSFTTTKTGDLTAVAFVGNQGTNATISITNSAGQIVNGQKWGADVPNPQTMNQEFVGADAGVQPAGTYEVHYNGPSNGGHDVYALEVDYPQGGQQATVPSAPQNLTATGGSGQAVLNWQVPSSDGGASITGYNVYRGATPGGEGTTPVATDVTGTTFTDTGLAANTTYYYEVAATNPAGTGPDSNEASAATAASVTPPSAPQNFTATGGSGQVALNWQTPSSDGGASITGYNVYRGTTPGGEGTTPVATGVSGTSYTDTGLAAGTTYYYKVTAVNSAGESSASNEGSATTVSTGCSSPVTGKYSGSMSPGKAVSEYVTTGAAGDLTATATWTGGNPVSLIIYDSNLNVLGQSSSSSGSVSETLHNLSAATYKVKVQDGSSSTGITWALSVTHC